MNVERYYTAEDFVLFGPRSQCLGVEQIMWDNNNNKKAVTKCDTARHQQCIVLCILNTQHEILSHCVGLYAQTEMKSVSMPGKFKIICIGKQLFRSRFNIKSSGPLCCSASKHSTGSIKSMYQIDHGLVFNHAKQDEMRICIVLSQKYTQATCGMRSPLGRQSNEYLPWLHLQGYSAIR